MMRKCLSFYSTGRCLRRCCANAVEMLRGAVGSNTFLLSDSNLSCFDPSGESGTYIEHTPWPCSFSSGSGS